MPTCSKYPRELCHYNKQLKKNCFRRLKNNVWESKTKWKLILKAQRNYHRKLIWSTYHAWLAYAIHNIGKRKKLEIADEYCVRKSKRKAFLALKYEVEWRWVLMKQLDIVRILKLKERSWKYWRKYVRKSLRTKEINLLTDNMRKIYLMKTAIQMWFNNFSSKIFIQMKCRGIVMHHNILLKRQYFIAWENYHKHKIHKEKFVSYVFIQTQLKLKKRFFIKLKQYMVHKKLYEKHMQCVKMFYEKYMLKSVIHKWNVKYEELMDIRNRDKVILAIKFHEGCLIEKYYKKLKIWSEETKSRNNASQLFINTIIKLYIDIWRKFHRETLLSNSFEEKAEKWRSNQLKLIYITTMLESLEEKRNEIRKVENFIIVCNSRLKNKSFRKWQSYSYFKMQKKMKYNLVQHHYITKVIRKSFRLLHSYSVRKVNKRDIVNYYNCRLLLKSFNLLKCYKNMKKIRREYINKLQERYRIQLMRRAFSLLNEKTASNRNKMQVALQVAENKIKRKTFQLWKKFCERKIQKNTVMHNIQLIFQDIIIQNIITQWRKKTCDRTLFKEKLNKVKSNQEKRMIKHYLRKWIFIMEKISLLREKCRIFNQIFSQIVSQHFILKMIEVWKERRMIKDKESLALDAEKVLLMRRYLKRWITFLTWKKEKLRECSARIFHFKHSDDGDKCSGYTNVKFRRKQPMIPLYLREELLHIQENIVTQSFSSSDTYDVSSPPGENFPAIY